jgi:hypothetical protein
MRIIKLLSSVVDPDPYVFGPPGLGSINICTDPDPSMNKQKKKENLDFSYILLFFDFTFKKEIRKKTNNLTERAESGSVPICHGPTTLTISFPFENRTPIYENPKELQEKPWSDRPGKGGRHSAYSEISPW